MNRSAVRLLACVAILGLAAACTTENKRTPPNPTQFSVEVPKDRDEQAVLAALRRLDLCALLDPTIVATPSLPAIAKPETGRPFGCDVGNLPGQQLSVIATSMTWNTRLTLPTRPLGGAKSYVRAGSTSNCDVYLPVSFTLAINFRQTRPGTAADAVCQSTADVAAAAATALANPAAVQVEPTWDACSVLATALGPDAEEHDLAETDVGICIGNAATVQTTLSFAGESMPRDPPRVETIGDKQVQIFQQDESCEVYWRHGPFNSRYARAADYQVRIATPDCARATKLAESVIDVLDQPPPTDVAPQQPLLYAPDEPDGPFPGACAYLSPVGGEGQCEPAIEVRVPAGSAAIRKAVDADPNVLCAMLRDPIAKHLGAGLRPVTVADAHGSCYFVAPERLIQVKIAMLSSSASEAAGTSDPSREVSIAGHSGYVFAEAGLYRYLLATSADVSADGAMELTVSTGPVNSGGALPAGTDKKAEAVLADLLQAHFS